jgi:hypothetical protein
MDMGKTNVRLAAEATVRSKARPVVVVTGYKGGFSGKIIVKPG